MFNINQTSKKLTYSQKTALYKKAWSGFRHILVFSAETKPVKASYVISRFRAQTEIQKQIWIMFIPKICQISLCI